MKVAILSRNKNLHSIRRLAYEAKKLGVECVVLDPLEMQMVVHKSELKLLWRGHLLPAFDGVLPRIGSSITDFGVAIVRHFEGMGTYVSNGSLGILQSRDKFRSLQLLSQARLRVPSTVLTVNARGMKPMVQAFTNLPSVVKLNRGTQGVGVMLLHSHASLSSVLDTFETLEEPVLVQEFLKVQVGTDYRVFVIGGRVIGSMRRTAPKGDFRSNIHRGGKGTKVSLPASYRRLAIRAADKLGLDIAGVDLMDGPDGPTVLEVNSSPGFEGFEKASGINVGALIMKHFVQTARGHRRKMNRKKK